MTTTTATINLHFLFHAPALPKEPSRATFLCSTFQMLPHHTDGLQRQESALQNRAHAYTQSCKTAFTEETWLGLIVQLRCTSPAPDAISEHRDRRRPVSEKGSLKLQRRWSKEPSSILIRDRGKLQALILLTRVLPQASAKPFSETQ